MPTQSRPKSRVAVPLDPTLHDFDRHEFGRFVDLVRSFGQGHDPLAVMVTCSHLGFAPDEMSHANRGELWIIQHVGNTVPPPGTRGSALASLCLALRQETVRHAIVCGHTRCGCLKQVLDAKRSPGMQSLMYGLEPVKALIEKHYGHVDGDAALDVGARESVLVQLEHLRRHEVIRASLRTGRLALHGWVVCDETAMVRYFDPMTRQFESPPR